jgi:hypothetical protein
VLGYSRIMIRLGHFFFNTCFINLAINYVIPAVQNKATDQ